MKILAYAAESSRVQLRVDTDSTNLWSNDNKMPLSLKKPSDAYGTQSANV